MLLILQSGYVRNLHQAPGSYVSNRILKHNQTGLWNKPATLEVWDPSSLQPQLLPHCPTTAAIALMYNVQCTMYNVQWLLQVMILNGIALSKHSVEASIMGQPQPAQIQIEMPTRVGPTLTIKQPLQGERQHELHHPNPIIILSRGGSHCSGCIQVYNVSTKDLWLGYHLPEFEAHMNMNMIISITYSLLQTQCWGWRKDIYCNLRLPWT